MENEKEKGTGNLGINNDPLSLDSLINQATVVQRKLRAHLMTKRKDGEPFTRIKWVSGKPYYYLVQNYYDEKGKRRQRVLKYYGVRPPRGAK